jgi:hypothetical protein
LLPGNEPGSITGGTGGELPGIGLVLDDANDADPNMHTLTLANVGWGSSQGFIDLTSSTSASHIHGPTTNPFGNTGTGNFTDTAGVLKTLSRSTSLSTGGVFSNINLLAAEISQLGCGAFVHKHPHYDQR